MSKNGIYLYGYYGQGNLGDDLLMASAVGMIREAVPSAPIFVHCHDPARVPDLGVADVHLVPASAVLADTGRSKPARMADYLGLLRTTFGECRALVFGGGTVLQEGGSPLGLLVILATVMQAKKHGLKVIAIGAGIGAARTRLGRFLLRRIVKRIDVLCLRDASSMAAVAALVPSKSVRAVADLVYALPLPDVSKSVAAPRAIFSIQPAVTARRDAMGSAVRAALNHTIASFIARGWPCTLLAFETKREGAPGLDDREAWKMSRVISWRAIRANSNCSRLRAIWPPSQPAWRGQRCMWASATTAMCWQRWRACLSWASPMTGRSPRSAAASTCPASRWRA